MEPEEKTVQELADEHYRAEQELAVEQALRERDDEYLRDAMQEMI